MLIESSLGDGGTWVTEGCGAAAVWVAPGGQELSPQAEARLEPFIGDLVGEAAPRLLDTMSRFDAAHPHGRPALLPQPARDPSATIAATAREWACWPRRSPGSTPRPMPAFLESSNAANDARYERLGFRPIGRFELGEDGPDVTQMWREPR